MIGGCAQPLSLSHILRFQPVTFSISDAIVFATWLYYKFISYSFKSRLIDRTAELMR